MSISDEWGDMFAPQSGPVQTGGALPGTYGSGGDMSPKGKDHTTTLRIESVGMTLGEAAGRSNVILDKDQMIWREMHPDERLTKDSVRAFDLGGGNVVDMTMKEAFEFGLITEWDEAWGDITNPYALTEEEQALIEEGENRGVSSADVLEGFSSDTPIEAANLNLDAQIAGIAPAQLAEMVDQIGFDADGNMVLSDDASEFLSDRMGFGSKAAEVVQGVRTAWRKIAEDTIGADAIASISQAAQHNPQATADLRSAYRLAASGQLTRGHLTTLAEKWSR